MKEVIIVGGGLAGCEASYQLLKKGYHVKLYEMRPTVTTEAHQTSDLAELVCSNSLRSNDPYTAVGMLKKEMQMFDSLIMQAASLTQVPAGSSLAVDRKNFSEYITNVLNSFANFELIKQEFKEINTNIPTIICAGPLVSNALFTNIQKLTNNYEDLHFFDAIAPIIEFDSIDMTKAYFKSRYDKGTASYINCPMTKEEYDLFYHELINAKTVAVKDFENNVFEGCMPVEVMAQRGHETLTFGPLKPVGLEHNGKRYHAVVQLRQDDARKTMYNIVGFQTHLTWSEQKRIINLIPGLENANILRYGVMHRNTYLESPKILNRFYQVLEYPNIFFAGQISGVEGYVESSASAIVASFNMDLHLQNQELKPFPIETMLGAMARYISTPNHSFVPMNANFGLLDELGYKHKKLNRKQLYYERSMDALKQFLSKEDV